jgi:hypothetical protein
LSRFIARLISQFSNFFILANFIGALVICAEISQIWCVANPKGLWTMATRFNAFKTNKKQIGKESLAFVTESYGFIK